MKRLTGLAAVTATALLIVTLPQTAARAEPAANRSAVVTNPWPPPPCPPATDDALVAYSYGGGLARRFNQLVVYRDRYAALCWGGFAPCDPQSRRVSFCWHTGRTDFVVSRGTMRALTIRLQRLGVARLGQARPRRLIDAPSRSLAYKGTIVPADGYPSTRAGTRALGQAESILDRISFEHRGPA